MRWYGRDKRRIRRRLHPGVDTVSGDIMAHEPTKGDARDGPELPGLPTHIETAPEAVSADKAHDSSANRRTILKRGARPVIAPRKGAAITPPGHHRDTSGTRRPRGARACRGSSRSGEKAGNRKAATTAARSAKPQSSPMKRSSDPPSHHKNRTPGRPKPPSASHPPGN